jgi:hypothetical protein
MRAGSARRHSGQPWPTSHVPGWTDSAVLSRGEDVAAGMLRGDEDWALGGNNARDQLTPSAVEGIAKVRRALGSWYSSLDSLYFCVQTPQPPL